MGKCLTADWVENLSVSKILTATLCGVSVPCWTISLLQHPGTGASRFGIRHKLSWLGELLQEPTKLLFMISRGMLTLNCFGPVVEDKLAKGWDIRNGASAAALKIRFPSSVRTISFREGSQLVAPCTGGCVHVFDVRMIREEQNSRSLLTQPALSFETNLRYCIYGSCYLHDRDAVVISGYSSNCVQLWSMKGDNPKLVGQVGRNRPFGVQYAPGDSEGSNSVSAVHEDREDPPPCYLPDGSCSRRGTKACSKCFSAFYCSRRHQAAGWPSHKSLCRKICSTRDTFLQVHFPDDDTLASAKQNPKKVFEDIMRMFEDSRGGLNPGSIGIRVPEFLNRHSDSILRKIRIHTMRGISWCVRTMYCIQKSLTSEDDFEEMDDDSIGVVEDEGEEDDFGQCWIESCHERGIKACSICLVGLYCSVGHRVEHATDHFNECQLICSERETFLCEYYSKDDLLSAKRNPERLLNALHEMYTPLFQHICEIGFAELFSPVLLPRLLRWLRSCSPLMALSRCILDIVLLRARLLAKGGIENSKTKRITKRSGRKNSKMNQSSVQAVRSPEGSAELKQVPRVDGGGENDQEENGEMMVAVDQSVPLQEEEESERIRDSDAPPNPPQSLHDCSEDLGLRKKLQPSETDRRQIVEEKVNLQNECQIRGVKIRQAEQTIEELAAQLQDEKKKNQQRLSVLSKQLEQAVTELQETMGREQELRGLLDGRDNTINILRAARSASIERERELRDQLAGHEDTIETLKVSERDLASSLESLQRFDSSTFPSFSQTSSIEEADTKVEEIDNLRSTLQEMLDDLALNRAELIRARESLVRKKNLSGLEEEHVCVICWERKRTILLLPCRHFCLCSDCKMVENCPICRQAIATRIEAFVS